MIRIGDRQIAWRPGMTLADALRDLPDAEHCAVVRLDGRTVGRHRFASTPVADEATVVLIPLVAGG